MDRLDADRAHDDIERMRETIDALVAALEEVLTMIGKGRVDLATTNKAKAALALARKGGV